MGGAGSSGVLQFLSVHHGPCEPTDGSNERGVLISGLSRKPHAQREVRPVCGSWIHFIIVVSCEVGKLTSCWP